MDGGSMVLNSISCKGVKCFTLFQKPSLYAVISINDGGGDDRHPKQQKHKTTADHEGGENPEWDQSIQIDLDFSDFKDLFLEFRIKAHGNLLLGDKLIGKSRVLVADLTDRHPSGVVRHVSYRVQSPDGKPNGVLSFSYKLNLPGLEIRIPHPLDPVITSAPLQDYCLLPSVSDSFISLPSSAPTRRSLYPPLPLPEAAPVDVFYHNQPSPMNLTKYYTPPPPPPPVVGGYYHPPDRAVYRDPGNFHGPTSANREYYPPPPAALPPPSPTTTFGTYYPPSAQFYTYPPPQDSCCYCNFK